jgi:phosphate transport system substrate-binding protein
MSDSPYTAASKRASLIHVPLIAGPIAVMINIPTLTKRQTVSLSAPTIAGIFAGKITKWNDPAIAADNNRTYKKVIYDTDKNGNVKKNKAGKPIILDTQDVKQTLLLPNREIQVVYRQDGSGTTQNFVTYLTKSVPSVWTKPITKVFADSFPGNINGEDNFGRIVGAQSSNGVAVLAGKTPYSISYAEVNYAAANKLKVANLINPAGASVAADNAGVGAFLASATQDANGFLTYDYATKEPGAYPLAIASYLLADTKYPDKAKAEAVKAFANYILSPACSGAKGDPLGFSVIDGALLKKAQAQVAKIG